MSGQYVMQNNLVYDCEGTLTDSEEGPSSGQYDHEEDYLFTVCVEGASEIIVNFDFFATEATYDVLTIYDGPDVNSPVIAVLDGVLNIPPIVVANSGCISFHFVSDENIVAQGWSLNWTVEVDEIADPILEIDSPLECPLGDLQFSIDPSVPCDILLPENFQILGPQNGNISEVIPLNCNSDNRSSSFQLVLADSLSLPGTYLVVFAAYIVNSCGDTLEFESRLDFELSDCPFQVEIHEVEAACAGDCGRVEVEIHSTDPGPYAVSWAHSVSTQNIVNVCTDSVTLVEVNVVNLSNGQSASDQFFYTPIALPQILNPLLGDTFCSSRGHHYFDVDIPGGLYNARYMDNTDDERYNFRRYNNANGIQFDIITYTDENGCVATDSVYILPVNAGPDQAACLEENELVLVGNNPDNGIWQGPNTSPDGIFTIDAPGEYTISFISPDGCIDRKLVDVIDEIQITPIDTLCSTQEINLRDFVNAYGGIWTGPGISQARNGRLRAWQANINELNTYYYQVEGCRDSITIFIQGLWAGVDRSVCSMTDVIQLPFDGLWEGDGIYNPIDSTYDISGLTPGTYEITGSKGRCEDSMELTIHDVGLDYVGDPKYCFDAGMIPIEDIVATTPDDGVYTGEAIVNINDVIYLDPALVAGTESYVVFEALGCLDSVLVEIEPALELDDYEFCEFDDLQTLDNQGNIGYWEGPGILLPEDGLLNVQALNVGYNEVYFVTDLGCRTPVVTEVVGFVEAEINDVLEIYCFQDSNYILDLFPAGGIFTINGIDATAEINPADLGSGFHECEYIVGTGECEDKTTTYIQVSEPISGNTYATNDTLCPNEATTIFVESSGGFDLTQGYWDQGLGFGKSHIVFPSTTTTYTVTLTDGCSDDIELELEIVVNDSFDVGFNYGPPVCFGDSSYIEISNLDPDNFDINWNGISEADEMIYTNLPGQYYLNVIERETGCEQEYWLDVPGADPISAGFTIVPNQDTIDLINNEISLINQAQGYTSGHINFGQGTENIDLDYGDLNTYYDEIGEYIISQMVVNDLGCVDTMSRKIYVDNVLRIYAPNIFNPGIEGENGSFRVFSLGSNEMEVSIYNRWGNLIFNTTNIDEAWDGTIKNKPAKQGVYTVLVNYADQKTGEVYQKAFGLTLVR